MSKDLPCKEFKHNQDVQAGACRSQGLPEVDMLNSPRPSVGRRVDPVVASNKQNLGSHVLF